jgi:hypothetical protein
MTMPATRTAGAVGCLPPTTKTSARCTCCSRLTMFLIRRGDGAGASGPSCSGPACSCSSPSCSTSSPPCTVSSWCSGPSCRPSYRAWRTGCCRCMIGASGHGVRAHEQLELLADDRRLRQLAAAAPSAVPGGAAATQAGRMYAPLSTCRWVRAMDMTGIFAIHLLGISVDHGFDQHHHHHLQHARSGHDADADADVRAWTCLITAYLHHRGDAGTRRRHDHDADRPSFRHQLLQCGRWG